MGVRALFVGSFDPFHEGHRNIAERALRLFDELLIGVSHNDAKTYTTSAEKRAEAIAKLFAGEKRVKVLVNKGLTIDFARENHCDVIIKGLRNTDDFIAEQKQALWNKEHGAIETLLLMADRELQDVCSTEIRRSGIN